MFIRHRGFSLIEVLVAMVVLSVGLLGLAALQIAALRSAGDANIRAQATLLLNELAERVHANDGATSANYVTAMGTAGVADCTALPNPYCSAFHNGAAFVASATCTTPQMAIFDLWSWQCGMASDPAANGGIPSTGGARTLLPAEAGTTPLAVTANGNYLILATSWDEVAPQGGAVTQTITMTILP